MVRRYGASLLAILAFAWFPVLAILLVSAVAGAAGCRVDEAAAYPCSILGVDVGGLLYTMGVLGWLMLVTLPTGAVLLGCWLLILLVHLACIAWRNREAGPR